MDDSISARRCPGGFFVEKGSSGKEEKAAGHFATARILKTFLIKN